LDGPLLLLQITKIIADLIFSTPAYLEYWLGSTFRGAIGHQLKHLCCSNSHFDCQTCNLTEKCLFFSMYMNKTSKKGYAAPLKPIIFVPQFLGKALTLVNNGRLRVEIFFFGDNTKYLPHIISSLKKLGRRGLGTSRHKTANQFYIGSLRCGFSGREILDGDILLLKNLLKLDLEDVPLFQEAEVHIGFKTPFTTLKFPPSLKTLLRNIRHRIILLCNQHGSGITIPEFQATGSIIEYNSHFHKLVRRSIRSGRHLLKGYTGTIFYRLHEVNDIARWLLNSGFIIGAGSNIAFGCGFLQNLGPACPSAHNMGTSISLSGILE